MKIYGYVGPGEIADRIGCATPGRAVRSLDDAHQWIIDDQRTAPVVATFVIDLSGTLRLAPRRSEHLACAGGQPVLSAGELTLEARPNGTVVATDVSNHSTGYCPEPESWPAVASALDAAGIERPEGFTTVIVFRRCDSCGQRNIVKDGDFTCAVCAAELAEVWNFATDW